MKRVHVGRLCLFRTVRLADCRRVHRRRNCASPHMNFKALIRSHTLPPLMYSELVLNGSVFLHEGQKRCFLLFVIAYKRTVRVSLA